MATHIAFEEQRLSAAYWTLRDIQRQKETKLVQEKIREQQQSGFMRGTASDRAISSSAANRQEAPTASDKLQRKLYRQNKRLKRWAMEEDISCSAVDAVLGSETSDEVFREESTPRADQPANIAHPVTGTRQHPPSISTQTLEHVKPARRVMTPMCSAFLSVVAASSRGGRVHATNQNVEAKVAAPGSTRARRGSLQSDGPALRSAVRSALSGSCRVSAADEAPPRCHSSSTVNPSGSAASSTSSMSTGNCSSTSDPRPWRPIRRLSNASQMILQSPAACKPAVAASPDRLNIQYGVHVGQAKQLELRSMAF